MYIAGINMYYTILHNTYHTQAHITNVVCGLRSSECGTRDGDGGRFTAVVITYRPTIIPMVVGGRYRCSS